MTDTDPKGRKKHEWVLGLILLGVIEVVIYFVCSWAASAVTEPGWVQTLLKTEHHTGNWWGMFRLAFLICQLILAAGLLAAYTAHKSHFDPPK